MSGSSVEAPAALAPRPVAIRAQASRDDWLMRALLALVGLFFLAALVLPLWTIFSRSLRNRAGEFIGLANYATYFETPALSISIWNSCESPTRVNFDGASTRLQPGSRRWRR